MRPSPSLRADRPSVRRPGGGRVAAAPDTESCGGLHLPLLMRRQGPPEPVGGRRRITTIGKRTLIGRVELVGAPGCWFGVPTGERGTSCGLRPRIVRNGGDDGAMTTYSGTKEFEGATFVKASFKGATLRFSDVSGVTMRSVDVDGLDIDSHDLFFGSLFVNGVDVVPLVDAELNRQFPGRELQKAQTPEGLREGWVAVQSAWQATVAGTPPDLVDAHVEDEWSLAQTLRHLILATDAWLRGGILRMRAAVPRDRPDLHRCRRDGLRHVDLPRGPAGVRGDPRGAGRATAAGDRLPGHGHAGAARGGTREPVGRRRLASQRR